MIKNADIGKYKYFGCSIGFDRKGEFSFGNGVGKNVIIFGVDMSSSPHINKKKRYLNSWWRSHRRIRTYTDCRKNVFN